MAQHTTRSPPESPRNPSESSSVLGPPELCRIPQRPQSPPVLESPLESSGAPGKLSTAVSSRILQNSPEFSGVLQRTKVPQSLPESPEFSSVLQNFPQSSSVLQSPPEPSRVFQNLRESSRVSQNLPESSRDHGDRAGQLGVVFAQR